MTDDRRIIRVDMSQLGVWLDCQVKEYFRYQLTGRGVEPKTSLGPESPFTFGNIGHFAMEVWEHPQTWHNRTTVMDAVRAKWEEYQAKDQYRDNNRLAWAKLLQQVANCIQGYLDHYEEFDNQYEPLKPEAPFEIDLTPNNPKLQVIYYGKLDNLVRRKEDGRIYAKEYKFYAQMDENPFYLGWARQLSNYSYAGVAMFGADWGGIDYRITRKVKSPTLINYYQHIYRRTREQLKTAAKYIVVQAMQMQRLREMGTTFLIPILDDHPMKVANSCIGCDYRAKLCNAFIEGEDWESIVELDYQPRHLYAEHDETDSSNLIDATTSPAERGMAF